MGQLIMPIINGVSDGALAIVGLSIFTCFVSSNFWATPIIDGRWLNISGIEVLTIGQSTALLIVVLA